MIVVSIYMLLDMPTARRARSTGASRRTRARQPLLDADRARARRLREGAGAALADHRHERRASGCGCSARSGCVPGADKYALLFGAWVAVTELIPYLGPWLGAIPPLIYALVVHPVSALWVALLFLVIHQIEGHIVVPNVMGSALRLHPLLVIFGLLAGGEIYGLPGHPRRAAAARRRRGRCGSSSPSGSSSSRGSEGGAVPVEVEVERAAAGRAGAAEPTRRPLAASR